MCELDGLRISEGSRRITRAIDGSGEPRGDASVYNNNNSVLTETTKMAEI